MNKKGKEAYVSWWNAIIWIAVFAMFTGGILIFNKSQTDIRGEESRILAKRVADCVTEKEFLLQDLSNLLRECSLNKPLIAESGKFLIKIEFIDVKNSPPIIFGNLDLEVECGIKTSESDFAACYSTRVLTKNSGVLLITTSSNNKGETA